MGFGGDERRLSATLPPSRRLRRQDLGLDRRRLGLLGTGSNAVSSGSGRRRHIAFSGGRIRHDRHGDGRRGILDYTRKPTHGCRRHLLAARVEGLARMARRGGRNPAFISSAVAKFGLSASAAIAFPRPHGAQEMAPLSSSSVKRPASSGGRRSKTQMLRRSPASVAKALRANLRWPSSTRRRADINGDADSD
jgi:hypothetical protein